MLEPQRLANVAEWVIGILGAVIAVVCCISISDDALKNMALTMIGTIVAIVALMFAVARRWARFIEKDANKRFDGLQMEFASRFGWTWSLDRDAIWEKASEIVESARSAGKVCIETSSIPPDPDKYEASVSDLATAWLKEGPNPSRRFCRVFCFSDDPTDPQDAACASVFRLVLDGTGQQDTDGVYCNFRQCIDIGKVQVLHLPFRLLTDYLTLLTNDNKYDCLFSFAPPNNVDFAGSVRISDPKIGRIVTEHVEHIVSLAMGHCMGRLDDHSKCSICSRYGFDPAKMTLLPRK